MKTSLINLVVISLLASIIAILVFIATRSASGGDKVICQLEPYGENNWHYRTKIDGRPEKCWYVGPRMKPRNELYWAESPKIPPIEIKVPESVKEMQTPWTHERRWQGAVPGWEHKE